MLASNPTTTPAKALKKSKLSDEQTSALIAKWQTGDYKQTTLAQEFGVTQGYVSMLVKRVRRVRRATYRHEQDLNGNWRWFVYGYSGEQLEGFFTEEAAISRVDGMNNEAHRNALIAEKRALEKRIREINNELADLEGLPF